MSDERPSILVVDDETGILETLEILLRGSGLQVRTAAGGKAGLVALEEEVPQVLLTDIRMPGVSGLEILQRAHELDPELPVILMTAQASLQSAMRAVNEGAFYYLQKPFSNDELLAICRRALEVRNLKVENRRLKKEIQSQGRSRGTRPIGRSRSFVDLLQLAETAAPTESTILITGESGTGKEVLARFIHARSARSENAFHSLNCGALPESLLESELFGHMKGSFTGAVRDKDGLLVAASGGTFFLDEIGEMAPKTQVKLLRAIQEREVTPVGATESKQVDVRIIAATNRNLEEEIRSGRFRSDLYYRLNVINLTLPPLRERTEDIPLLARHFLTRFSSDPENPRTLTDAAMSVLLDYDWPGNVRELENALERASVLGRGDEIGVEALPVRVRERPAPRVVSDAPPPNPTMEVIEQAYIHWVLQAADGNKSRAAEILGIDPSTLYRKINRYGIGGG